MASNSRRAFLKAAAAGVLAPGVVHLVPGTMANASAPNRANEESDLEPIRVTLAQIEVTRDVAVNLAKGREVFRQAAKDRAGWVMFPEMFLSGYYGEFDQDQVAAAFDELRALCGETGVVGLLSTGWRDGEKVYNQIRVVDRAGHLASVYAKTCLCYGEAEWTSPGPFSLVHSLDGLTFGTLICNDLWVTPGFSDGPNPHLTKRQAEAGAQVIFHAINSGNNQNYRAYHESNLLVRAAEAKCPIVAVNAFRAPAVNATSGVVGTEFAYLTELERDREVIRTVEFTPSRPRATT